jgi:hypothetical protein
VPQYPSKGVMKNTSGVKDAKMLDAVVLDITQ